VSTGRLMCVIEGVGVLDVAFDPEGARVIAGEFGDLAKVWDFRTGREQLTSFGDSAGVDFSRDGRVATGGVGGSAKVWEITRTEAREFVRLSHTAQLWNVDLSPEGTKLLTGGPDGPIRLWDVSPEGGREWWTAPGATQ
jgi:WD40 repeat protein